MAPTANSRPDAESRIWAQIERLDGTPDERTVRAAKLGKLFFQLRNLYSEREKSGAGRRSSGHGTFQRECIARGYQPRRVRELVHDYEALQTGGTTTAEKRKARRHEPRQRKTYQQGFRDASNTFSDFGFNILGGASSDPIACFARLLPYPALKSAYRAALQECHPDHGGSEDSTKALIAAWEEVKRFFEDQEQLDVDTGHHERTQ